jgi:hypothetical protein
VGQLCALCWPGDVPVGETCRRHEPSGGSTRERSARRQRVRPCEQNLSIGSHGARPNRNGPKTISFDDQTCSWGVAYTLIIGSWPESTQREILPWERCMYM